VNATPYRETELYPPVRDFLVSRGYTVRGEVNHCDVAAIRPGAGGGEELVVVELKKGLTIELLVQGTKRQREADLVYLAIPRPARFWFNRKWRDLMHLLRRLELGLMLVDPAAPTDAGRHPSVEVVLDPAPFDRARSQSARKNHRAGLLKEIKGRSRDANAGGSTGVKLMTAYRERSLAIARALAAKPDQSPAELRSDPADKKTALILRNNVYGWFVRLDRGRYGLAPAGNAALAADSPDHQPVGAVEAAEAAPDYAAANAADAATSKKRKPTRTSKPT
jgi:hypothetical protein